MKQGVNFDPTTLEIYRALYTSVAEEMGIALRRTAFSPNIKERRDYSCAVFDAKGRVIAQGDHMPVHLGSMPMAVGAVLNEMKLAPGDAALVNDPFAGGTHLPDITLVAGVFEETKGTRKKLKNGKDNAAHKSRSGPLHPLFYVANRAHHADVGGAAPGSMGLGRDVYAEGIRVPPVRIMRGGRVEQDVMRLLLANVRASAEREADLQAQIGSLRTGARRLLEIVERAGKREVQEYAGHLISYSTRLMRRTIAAIPDGVYQSEDCLDSDGVSNERITIRVQVTIKDDRAIVDFTGSAPQVAGPVNAVEAITVSAVAYVFRCLIETDDVPASAGLMQPIAVVAPEGTIVNARHPAAVAGGNVETSQRIVDVLLRALAQALPEKIPAASQGTMNNLTIGGVDLRNGREFAYYETIAGGMGARPASDGLSGVHTHMTNSLNTPAEALEYAYPLRVRRYAIRRNSGGGGRTRGGDGLVREIETLAPARMSLLAERRRASPYGLHGGQEGKAGHDSIVSCDGSERLIEAKGTWELQAGDVVRIETPGGGGHQEK